MHRYHKWSLIPINSGMATSHTRNLAMAHLILISSGLLPAAFWKSRQCQRPLRRMGRCCPEHERWAAVSAGVSFISCKPLFLLFSLFLYCSQSKRVNSTCVCCKRRDGTHCTTSVIPHSGIFVQTPGWLALEAARCYDHPCLYFCATESSASLGSWFNLEMRPWR